MACKKSFSAKEALDYCLESDEDSSTGGLTIDEEEAIDAALIGQNDYTSYER